MGVIGKLAAARGPFFFLPLFIGGLDSFSKLSNLGLEKTWGDVHGERGNIAKDEEDRRRGEAGGLARTWRP